MSIFPIEARDTIAPAAALDIEVSEDCPLAQQVRLETVELDECLRSRASMQTASKPTRLMSMEHSPPSATAAEIVEIVGALDDAVLLSILETGATAAEVLEAFTWATADDQIGTELERRPRGAAARVYEILKSEEPEPDERR
ncbi:MAG: hypothetical protein WA633_24710 [Stellaceae bacterium]